MASVSDDLLLAYPPFGASKLARLLALPEKVTLSVALDSSHALQGLAGEARKCGREVGVLVEVDVGLRRTGIRPMEDVLRLAQEAVDTAGVRYKGIMIYPGHIRMPFSEQAEAIQDLSEELGRYLHDLNRAGLSPEVVSGGSTPTFFRSHEVTGVTEVRSGTGIFNDRTTALMKACRWTDCAFSVLATVVSTSVPGQVVVDAGSKALAKETVRGQFQDPTLASGFGCVRDRPELRVTALSEEHGVIENGGTDWRPDTGDLVQIVPNHVCVSVNLSERLWKVRGDRVMGWWEIEARGRAPWPLS
jgi:D-serine deaminase-like pyridoxal phosphate-dependent protein